LKQLNPLAIVVLSLLDERPMHPYEVTFHVRKRHMEKHVKVTVGALYHTFEKLQEEGLIEPMEVERDGRRPERTVYGLTAPGREQFQEGLRRLLVQPSRVYSDFEAGLACMHHLAAGEAAQLLRKRAEILKDEMESEGAHLRKVRDLGLSRLCLIETELVQDLRQYQVEWCARVADEIETGELEWYAGILPRPGRDRSAPAGDGAVGSEVNGR
jgi:DNA-binding PadR family transcriptional regulator